MEPSQSSFPAAWWGTELPGVRPRVGTYGRYNYEAPRTPAGVQFRDTFDWLLAEPAKGDNIVESRWDEIAGRFDQLSRSCADHAIELPASFRTFFAGPELAQRIRSCTACFLDLAADVIPSPSGDGSIARFLSDQQGCMFWYLHLPPGAANHGVLASPDYFGSDAEELEFEPGDPDSIVFCAAGFEAFVYRFWLENEFWYASNGSGAPSAAAVACLKECGWSVPLVPERATTSRDWWKRLFGRKS